ncbi:MAG: hypothetical protein ACQ9CV_04580 [Nitrosopumilus sp.]
MEEESNPIKDLLFEYIQNSEKIPKLMADKKYDLVIEDVTKNCYDKVTSMWGKEESVAVLCTGLLHYLLTNALITSQRKVEYNGNELDIVIPNIKTLEKDPKKTLLIYIAKTSDVKVINEEITSLEKFQSEKENIWAVLSENIPIKNKSFILNKENNSFSKIIFEIAQFSNVGGANKFKILRI